MNSPNNGSRTDDRSTQRLRRSCDCRTLASPRVSRGQMMPELATPSRRLTFAALTAMGFASLALRFPGDHEIGVDSFAIHTLAQSIVTKGEASWVLNPLSYFGWFPVSYPSAGPFLLATTNALATTTMEGTILLASLVFGLVGILTSFLMAREFRQDGPFALAVALVYSLAPRFLVFNLWQASTRNIFMAFLPIFIWAMMRFYRQRTFKNLVMVAFSFFILAASHRLVVLVIVMTGAFLFAVVVAAGYRIVLRARPSLVMRSSKLGLTRWVALAATVAVGASFLMGTNVLSQYSVGELASGTDLSVELLNLAVSITRSVGLAAPFAMVGLLYTPWVRGPTVRESFAVAGLVALVPTLLLRDYTGFYILPFLATLAAYGLQGTMKRLKNHRRFRRSIFVIATAAVVIVSGTILEYEKSHNPPLSPTTYGAATYMAVIVQGTTVVCNEPVTCSRIAALGGVRIVPTAAGSPDDPSPEVIIFNFYNGIDVTRRIVQVPVQNLNFNSNSFWTVAGLNPTDDYVRIVQSPMNGIPAVLVTRYDPRYYLETTSGVGLFYGDMGVAYPSPLGISLHEGSYVLYADGLESLWWM